MLRGSFHAAGGGGSHPRWQQAQIPNHPHAHAVPRYELPLLHGAPHQTIGHTPLRLSVPLAVKGCLCNVPLSRNFQTPDLYASMLHTYDSKAPPMVFQDACYERHCSEPARLGVAFNL